MSREFNVMERGERTNKKREFIHLSSFECPQNEEPTGLIRRPSPLGEFIK